MAKSTARFLVAAMAVAAMTLASVAGTGLAQAQTNTSTDRAALVALYNATDGDNWGNNTNWGSDMPLSGWHGVTTDSDGRVRRLVLSDNQLSGEIPSELGSLSNLEWLWLQRNQLSGVPPELGSLSNLESLDLSGNQLSGVPSELGNLSNLTHLYLRDNRLSGEIPSELGSLSNLRELHLQGNQLSGEIPPELGSLANLERLWLKRNQLSGVPPELGSLANLTHLYLSDNQLSGVPSELGSLSNLRWLELGDNQLSGEIPPELGSLANLTHLYLSDNQLSGEVPPELGSLANLRVLNLFSNQLSGEIPAELGSLANLETLALSGNDLTGGIPAELGNLTNLLRLTLDFNQLTGPLPTELGSLSNLIQLSLGHNGLTGPIPSELGNLSELKYLDLTTNELTGPIPAQLGNLTNLEYLRLEGNGLTGCIPPGLRNVEDNDLGLLGLDFCGETPPAEDPLIARYDGNGNDMIDKAEVIQAINDYLFGEGEEAISKAEVIRLINLYLFGPSTPSNSPGVPEGLTAAGNGPTRIDLSWSAPSSDGGAAITGYRIEMSEDGSTWTDLVANTGNAAASYSQTGLMAGITRYYRVSAINSAGTGPASNIATGTTPPEPTTPGTATSDRAALVALYNGMDGPTWPNSDNWLTDAPLDEWFGVTTDGSTGRVIDLTLIDNNLKGQLPPELGDLTALEGLDLGGNFIYDYNLSALSDLPSLRRLSLFRNFISDVSALSSLTQLELLALSDNGVSDISPLLDLPNLRFLSVWANPLTGRSIDEHIPVLQDRGVEVAYADIAFTGGGFTAEDGPQLYNDNLFILPVEPGEQVRNYAASFYRYFEDEFDFLMFITTDRLVLDTRAAGWFSRVINDVQGIGLDVFSHTQEYGSAGKLQGVTVFTAVHEFRIVALHELMHRWGAFILPGEVSVGPHWFEVSNVYGVLDGGYVAVPFDEIVALGGDRYSVTPPPPGTWVNTFGPLELYLAGFIPPEEVPDFWVAPDAEWVEWPRIFTASEIRRYTIDDVIAVHGRRVPEAAQAQREFRAAAILLIDENHAASMDVLEWLSRDVALFSHAGAAEDGQSNFYEGTGGRAKIVMDGLSQFRKDRDGE